MEGKVKNIKNSFFFVEVTGEGDIFCLLSQVAPAGDKAKIQVGAVVSFDSTESDPPKGPRAVGEIKIVTEAPAGGTTKSTREDKKPLPQVAVNLSFGKINEISFGNKEEIEAKVELSLAGKPAIGYKVELNETGESVLAPQQFLWTDALGKAMFLPTIADDADRVDFTVIVHFSSGQTQSYAFRWTRPVKEIPKPVFKIERTGYDNGIYSYKLSFVADAKIVIKATEKVLWKYQAERDNKWKTVADAPQLDSEGVAILNVKVDGGIGADVEFSSGDQTAKKEWLLAIQKKVEDAVGGSEQNHGRSNKSFWERVREHRRPKR